MMRAAALMIPLLAAACTTVDGQGPATTPATAEGPCRNEGLDRFIKTVRDIKLQFVTYSYSGN